MSSESSAATRPPEEWLGYLLSQLAGITVARTDAELRTLGLVPRAFGLLLTLSERGGVSQVEIAARLGMDRTTSSQLVEHLVGEGLIKRGVDPADRRSNSLHLTAKGRRRVNEASARAESVERALTADLPDAALEALRTTLRRWLASLREKRDGSVVALRPEKPSSRRSNE